LKIGGQINGNKGPNYGYQSTSLNIFLSSSN
jgi:hypothetical protein